MKEKEDENSSDELMDESLFDCGREEVVQARIQSRDLVLCGCRCEGGRGRMR